jgi:hypothetical protein
VAPQNQVGGSQPDPYRSSMTTREAARPLRRYMRARVRAASLAPTYTITRDVTSAQSIRSLEFALSVSLVHTSSRKRNHATLTALMSYQLMRPTSSFLPSGVAR